MTSKVSTPMRNFLNQPMMIEHPLSPLGFSHTISKLRKDLDTLALSTPYATPGGQPFPMKNTLITLPNTHEDDLCNG